MKVGTFSFGQGRPRRGILLGTDHVIDVETALAAHLIHNGSRRAEHLTMLGPHAWLGPSGMALYRELHTTAVNRQDLSAPYVQPLSEVQTRPPIPNPGKILAAGRNYQSHVAEGQELWAKRGREISRPPFPSGFVKLPSALIADGDPIEVPPGITTVDYEIELAVVIGQHARCIGIDDALDHVAGYTIANDVSAREVQLKEMEQLGLLVCKNFPTFAPLGPWLTTSDEVPDPQDLTMTLRVDGEVRQHAFTGDMLFTVAELVADWSRIGLDAGDVILTGTPAGVALGRPEPAAFYLRAGQVVAADITGIGQLRNPVRDAALFDRASGTDAARLQAVPARSGASQEGNGR